MTCWMPPEWCDHECCWMAWPRPDSDWPIDIESIYRNVAEVAEAVHRFEPVRVLVDPQDEAIFQHYLPGFDYLIVELDDCWLRDSGPSFVWPNTSDPGSQSKEQLRGVNWRFNGWGKFPHTLDAQVAKKLLETLGFSAIDSDLVCEGGAVQTNGRGDLLLTESVLLNDNRNPGWNKSQIEQELNRLLGAERFIWLPRGLIDDDTDGHIDELACFVSANQILALTTDDPQDPQYAILQDNLGLLKAARNGEGQPFDIVEVRSPPARELHGVRLARSYINYYPANGGIVMPSYREPAYDEAARRTLQACYPDRTIAQIDCSALVTGGGNIHCLTQPQPHPNSYPLQDVI